MIRVITKGANDVLQPTHFFAMDTDYYDPKTIIEDPDMSAFDIDLDGTEQDNELLSIAESLANGMRDLEYSEIDPEQTTADANDPESIFFHELKKKRDALQ
mgnify:CR=1 FL=1|jgi:hypothetical protein